VSPWGGGSHYAPPSPDPRSRGGCLQRADDSTAFGGIADYAFADSGWSTRHAWKCRWRNCIRGPTGYRTQVGHVRPTSPTSTSLRLIARVRLLWETATRCVWPASGVTGRMGIDGV